MIIYEKKIINNERGLNDNIINIKIGFSSYNKSFETGLEISDPSHFVIFAIRNLQFVIIAIRNLISKLLQFQILQFEILQFEIVTIRNYYNSKILQLKINKILSLIK